MHIPEKDRPFVYGCLIVLAGFAVAYLAGCADVPVRHRRPEVGCYPSLCTYSDGYECSCWAPGQCFETQTKCEENLSATVRDVAVDLFQQLANTNDVETI
jgi:hypothetical protein